LTTIDPRAAQKIQPYILSDETIHWAGIPDPKVIFHSDDWAAIPFSLFWGGFAIFWEAGAMGYVRTPSRAGGGDAFMTLWGIPFVLVGQYIIWGRFFLDAWLKRRTYYAVTNRRVIALQEGWNEKTSMTFLDALSNIEREGNKCGTLWFGPKYPVVGSRVSKKRSMSRFELGEITVFADIHDLDSVHRLVIDLRAKIESRANPPHILTYPSCE